LWNSFHDSKKWIKLVQFLSNLHVNVKEICSGAYSSGHFKPGKIYQKVSDYLHYVWWSPSFHIW
jgi:hypothetical protein